MDADVSELNRLINSDKNLWNLGFQWEKMTFLKPKNKQKILYSNSRGKEIYQEPQFGG